MFNILPRAFLLHNTNNITVEMFVSYTCCPLILKLRRNINWVHSSTYIRTCPYMPIDAFGPLPSPEEVQLCLSKHHSANNVIQSAIQSNKIWFNWFSSSLGTAHSLKSEQMFEPFNIWDATCIFIGSPMTHFSLNGRKNLPLLLASCDAKNKNPVWYYISVNDCIGSRVHG